MTERKFTDEEVIRALECCTTSADCEECPYYAHPACTVARSKDALDLINRQRAEIKILTENSISTKYPNHVVCSKGVILTKSLEEYDKLIADISAEAIKEFAERLRHTLVINNEENDVYFDYAYTLETIDNLVKEMTEGKPCTDGADCSTCEHCYHDNGYNECAVEGVKP